MCQPLQVVHICMSVICSHLKLGHNFLESFLATYGFARFFGQRFPTEENFFLNSVFDCSPLRNSKNFQIFGCACPRIELIRRCQPSRKFVVLGSLPRVLSYTLIDSHDRVSECSMMRSNCRAVKSSSFFTLIILSLVVLLFVDLLNVASMF